MSYRTIVMQLPSPTLGKARFLGLDLVRRPSVNYRFFFGFFCSFFIEVLLDIYPSFSS